MYKGAASCHHMKRDSPLAKGLCKNTIVVKKFTAINRMQIRKSCRRENLACISHSAAGTEKYLGSTSPAGTSVRKHVSNHPLLHAARSISPRRIACERPKAGCPLRAACCTHSGRPGTAANDSPQEVSLAVEMPIARWRRDTASPGLSTCDRATPPPTAAKPAATAGAHSYLHRNLLHT